MYVTDINNLYVGRNKEEDFNVLIVAGDTQEAAEIAETYRVDSNMSGKFEITEFTSAKTRFDCDYALTYSDYD